MEPVTVSQATVKVAVGIAMAAVLAGSGAIVSNSSENAVQKEQIAENARKIEKIDQKLDKILDEIKEVRKEMR